MRRCIDSFPPLTSSLKFLHYKDRSSNGVFVCSCHIMINQVQSENQCFTWTPAPIGYAPLPAIKNFNKPCLIDTEVVFHACLRYASEWIHFHNIISAGYQIHEWKGFCLEFHSVRLHENLWEQSLGFIRHPLFRNATNIYLLTSIYLSTTYLRISITSIYCMPQDYMVRPRTYNYKSAWSCNMTSNKTVMSAPHVPSHNHYTCLDVLVIQSFPRHFNTICVTFVLYWVLPCKSHKL